MNELINQIESRLLSGGLLEYEAALQLAELGDLEALFGLAHRVRQHYSGNRMDLCTIMNVKSGKCSENCKYCAQSAHYQTGILEYPWRSEDEIITAALENQNAGAHCFGLVASGRSLSQSDLEPIITIIPKLKRQTTLQVCGSFGMITFAQAEQLQAAGLDRYHHNLETCEAFFGQICDTHSYQERVATILAVKEAGLAVCSGGIIGMGESMDERLQMAFALRDLGVKSVPVNVLNPISGTPFANLPVLEPLEILKTMALFRLILPDAWIRYAGGRSALGALQSKGLQAGVNAALVGNFLTTVGNRIADDLKMMRGLGLEV